MLYNAVLVVQHESVLSIYTCVCVCKPLYVYACVCGGWGGFPGDASGREPSCQCKRHKRRGFNPWVGKIPWRREWQPTPVFLPEESHGQRSLAGYSS